MCSIFVISSHRRELASSSIRVRKKSGIPNFSTIAHKSCSWDLCHRGDHSIDEERFYFVTCCRSLASSMFGWACFVCLDMFAKFLSIIAQIGVCRTCIISMNCIE